uniref:NFACT protein C-terminal domain-containing protein n=1 Tax=Panagrolaimus superbus TaxID=310955 RepID=A0A914YXK6_9BILA
MKPVVINAWWVRNDQVSRTAPTGEYLPAGSFMIRGKKNYIPASQLQLGFGLLFRLDEESAANHKALEQDAASVMSRLSLVEEENVQEAEEGDDDEGEELKDEEEEEQQNEDDKEEPAVEDVVEEEEEDEVEDEDEFPDVELNENPKIINAGEDTEYTMVKFPQPQRGPRKVDPRQQYLEEKKRKEQEEEAKKRAENLKNQTGQISKRQKHKLDKIKKKYKDQTEEEREYNMQLLGHKKPEEVKPQLPLPPRIERPKPEKPEQPQPGDEEDDEDPEASAEGNNEDELVIQELCARTFNDDSLIYTVAVCAPYSSMQKFKYKVKITPGTGKRGKAAKMALQLFLRDKSATPAELNLIKGLVSDNNIASNIPGKVRVSAPQLLKMKK